MTVENIIKMKKEMHLDLEKLAPNANIKPFVNSWVSYLCICYDIERGQAMFLVMAVINERL